MRHNEDEVPQVPATVSGLLLQWRKVAINQIIIAGGGLNNYYKLKKMGVNDDNAVLNAKRYYVLVLVRLNGVAPAGLLISANSWAAQA